MRVFCFAVLVLALSAWLASIGGNAIGQTSPYLCAPSGTVPSAHPYPAIVWCDWQPRLSTNWPPNVRPCDTNPGFGELYFYSGANYTGKCAKVYVPTNHTLDYDYYAMELNGWYAYANNNFTQVRSWKMGGSDPTWGGLGTAVTFGQGESIWTAQYTCQFINTSPTWIGQTGYPSCANAPAFPFAPTVFFFYAWSP